MPTTATSSGADGKDLAANSLWLEFLDAIDSENREKKDTFPTWCDQTLPRIPDNHCNYELPYSL